MTDLTEKWKNGELESGWYFVKLYDRLNIVWLEYIQQDGFFGYYGNHITDYEVEQILAPVPSYEEWQSLNELVDCMSDTGKAFAHMLSPFTDDYFNGLTTKDIAELAKKSIRLTTQHCEDNAEIDKLKELLKECRPYVIRNVVFTTINKGEEADLERNILLTKIDEVLK